MFQEQYHGGHQFWACTIIGLAFSFVSANMKDSYFIKTYSGTNVTLKKVPFWLWRTNLEMFSVTLGDCKVNLALQKDYKKAWNRMPKLRPKACLPTRSLWGPLLTEFQFQETFDLQFVQPSWCLLVKTTYLSKMKIIIKVRHYFFQPSC